MSSNVVLAITGASGAAYGVRLLQVLLAAGRRVHLVISPSAATVIQHELGQKIDLENFSVDQLLPQIDEEDSRLQGTAESWNDEMAISSVLDDAVTPRGRVVFHNHGNFMAGIASGSFRTDGMVICPCSMGTLAAVAHGLSTNLIQRAADVHLKERRKLILVPRETPLGSIQLENMKRLADAGAVILPAMPGFYHEPKSIHDLIDFVVGRICDQLGVKHDLFRRWGSNN